MKWFKNSISLDILRLVLFASNCVKMAKVIDKDPGICDVNSRGNRVIVVDRDNNDRMIVCVRNDGIFSWKALDNLPTLGEYFHPAADCIEITETNKHVKDGFYWIKTSASQNVTKVWCDVTTDGGGFMLIGHQDSPVTWNVSSHPSVVAPHGPPHWSSSLGDASMLEFRIQISITDSPKQSRVDWLYRFKSARQLKHLLIEKQGCGNYHSGIGNIEYVKDLFSEKVVTQTFECSQFGYSFYSQLGWGRMNKCFTQTCKDGYAMIRTFRYDTNYGSYSYSTNSKKSGMGHRSTAFVGCYSGKCCACFGPKGATGNFCSPGCRSINGGTVTKNAHVWFWIRSSVPERPFLKKCMEYIVKTDQGNETHFIDTKTGVLKKGSCRKEGVANLIDGVIQVANKAGLEKVPLVKGLLSYRKDNEKLYLANGRSWKALGEENQIEDLVKSVSQLKAANTELQREVKVLKEKQNLLLKSCSDLYKNGVRKDGAYTIYPGGPVSEAFMVRCDMTTAGGGWTVFQRRMDGSVDFYLGWNEYKKGFGDLNGEFWLGLDNIHRLSKSGQSVLRVDLEDFGNNTRYAEYSIFAVENEADKYKLTVRGYSGNAGDSLRFHNGMNFTTKDVDNDASITNCAVSRNGAWWYNYCANANLNGRYLRAPSRRYYGVYLYTWKGYYYSLKKTEMKIRPIPS